MPNRILREGIITSHAVNALSDDAELLYRRLMSVVDDYGRFDADLDLIRARCFPLQLQRWSTVRIGEALLELGDSPLVTVFHRENKKYLQINNFGQRLQSKPKYPDPDSPESTVSHGDSPLRARATTPTTYTTPSPDPTPISTEPENPKPQIEVREAEPDLMYGKLVSAWQEVGALGAGSEDWKAAGEFWADMSIVDQMQAVKGLYQRKNAPEDPVLKSLPLNYLRGRKWEREIRTVKPNGRETGEALRKRALAEMKAEGRL